MRGLDEILIDVVLDCHARAIHPDECREWIEEELENNGIKADFIAVGYRGRRGFVVAAVVNATTMIVDYDVETNEARMVTAQTMRIR